MMFISMKRKRRRTTERERDGKRGEKKKEKERKLKRTGKKNWYCDRAEEGSPSPRIACLLGRLFKEKQTEKNSSCSSSPFYRYSWIRKKEETETLSV